MWFEPGELSKNENKPPCDFRDIATLEPENTETATKSRKVAEVADTFNSEIIVTCYTPAGNPIQVEARNAEHADFLQKMNPMPHRPASNQF
jgi:hypothetical protein